MPFIVANQISVFADLATTVEKQVSCLETVVSSTMLSSTSSSVSAALSFTASPLSNILKSPLPFKRAEKKRNYKLPNFGNMTDKSLLGKMDSDQLKKKQDEEIKLTLKNIKKEKVELRKKEMLEKKQQKGKKNSHMIDDDLAESGKMRKIDFSHSLAESPGPSQLPTQPDAKKTRGRPKKMAGAGELN